MRAIKLIGGRTAIVDDKNYEFLNQWKWGIRYSKGNYYAKRWDGSKEVFMHNLILKPRNGFEPDHENQNGLDNRETNLRYATPSQNRANVKRRKDNKSGYKGVCFHAKSVKWRAYIQVDKKWRQLGMYVNKEDAARAYNEAAKTAFGEFAWLNEI